MVGGLVRRRQIYKKLLYFKISFLVTVQIAPNLIPYTLRLAIRIAIFFGTMDSSFVRWSKLLLFALCLLCLKGQAQKDSLQLRVIPLDKAENFLKQFNYDKNFKSEEQLKQEIQKLLQQLHKKAYLAASVDTLFQGSKREYTAYLMVGERFEWMSLKVCHIAPEYLQAIGYKEKFYTHTPFHYAELEKLQNKLISYLENHAYPFARVYIDSIRIQENTVRASLCLDRGPLIRMSPLKINAQKSKRNNAKVRIDQRFLSNYLNLQVGKLYDESRIQKIQKRINELPYLKTSSAPYIVFREGEAEANLFLENHRASQFDILVGMQPNDNPNIPDRTKIELTGLVNIDLLNPFGTGKRIKLAWQQLKVGISELELAFNYPYIANLPFGTTVGFQLYKRDSSYIDIIVDLGFEYLLGGSNAVKGFWKNTTSNLLSVDTLQVRIRRALPTELDIRNSTFGIQYQYRNLDYRFNPRKGFASLLTASFSLKRIAKNNQIISIRSPSEPNFNYERLYDSIPLRTYQYSFEGEYEHFFPVSKWGTVMGRLRWGIIFAPSPLYSNELFRIGGNRILRGFDEESIFASWYNVFTTEFRVVFERNSYVYAFGDIAYTQTKSINQRLEDVPYSFGIGFALGTQIGIFTLSYALGTQRGNPIIFKNAKIHFGYVSLF